MSPPLREATAQEITSIIRSQGGQASFSGILVEAQRRGTLAWHRTLRRYLDLMVEGGVLVEKKRDVGSVNPQQLYSLTQEKPTVYVGPKILELHGLNWDTPLRGVYKVTTDMTGLLRSKPRILSGRHRLAASREDSLAHEIRRDADKTTGRLELVSALAATQTLDLPYLLRRGDELEIGRTVTLLFQKLIQTFTGTALDGDGRIFLTTRERFLQILRQYSKQKSLSLIETPGRGARGIRMVEALTPDHIVNAAGKTAGNKRMKRPVEIRTAPRDWLLVLKTAYPFLVEHGIGDLLLFGSQALSVYLNSPLRSKDLDLVSSQIGPRHLDSLRKHLETSGLETRSTTIQSKPLLNARMTIYTVELRLDAKPFFLEIFDKILDGQNSSVLVPYAQHVHKWDIDLRAPSPDTVVALRLGFRQPEGISRLNATRLNSFIRQNRSKLNFDEVRTMISRWGMEQTVKENLRTLHKSHRLRILNENQLYPREEL